MRTVITNVPFAVVVTAVAVVGGAAIAADSSGGPTQLFGVVAMGVVSGAGSCWVGTLVRRSRGRQD